MPLFTVTVHGWPSSLKSFLSLKEDIPYSHTGRSTQQTKRLSHSEKPMVLSLFMLLGGDKMKASFELWCWRRLLRVPWTARRSNRSILKEINPEHSLEELMLKLQSFGHLMMKWANSLGKNLDAGKDWGQEEKEATEDEMVGWHHWLSGHEFEQAPGDGEWDREAWHVCSPWSHKVRHNLTTEQQQQWWWFLIETVIFKFVQSVGAF